MMHLTSTSFSPTLSPGDRFYSPGMTNEYEIIGAVCLLFDRDTLPYPCCSLEWKGKQPSWRRDKKTGIGIGKRFVNDFASKNCEVYAVKLLNHNNIYQHYYTFTYWRMSDDFRKWWHGK